MKRKIWVVKREGTNEEWKCTSKESAIKTKNILVLRDAYRKCKFTIEEEEDDNETIPF